MNLCTILINCDEDYKDQLSSIFTYDESVLIPDENHLKKVYDIKESEIPVEDMIIDKISKLTVDY